MRSLYNWTVSWAEHRYASFALFFIAFIEASFFPIPPDPLLMLMTAADPKRWLRFAILITSGSVLGAVFGYFLGFFFHEKIGSAIISLYGYQDFFQKIGENFSNHSFLAVFFAAVSFVPFKIFTIASGFFGIPFFTFIGASILGRGARFFAEAFVFYFLGIKAHTFIEKNFEKLALVFAILIVLGYVLLRFLV